MPRDVRIAIESPVDPNSVPPLPGPLVGPLLFRLAAEYCDGGALAVVPGLYGVYQAPRAAAPPLPRPPPGPGPCTFVLGFRTLHDLIPQVHSVSNQ